MPIVFELLTSCLRVLTWYIIANKVQNRLMELNITTPAELCHPYGHLGMAVAQHNCCPGRSSLQSSERPVGNPCGSSGVSEQTIGYPWMADTVFLRAAFGESCNIVAYDSILMIKCHRKLLSKDACILDAALWRVSLSLVRVLWYLLAAWMV